MHWRFLALLRIENKSFSSHLIKILLPTTKAGKRSFRKIAWNYLGLALTELAKSSAGWGDKKSGSFAKLVGRVSPDSPHKTRVRICGLACRRDKNKLLVLFTARRRDITWNDFASCFISFFSNRSGVDINFAYADKKILLVNSLTCLDRDLIFAFKSRYTGCNTKS